MGKSKDAYRLLMGKPLRKCLLPKSRRRWEDNIKINLMELVFKIEVG
jgi:hypothetical protein